MKAIVIRPSLFEIPEKYIKGNYASPVYRLLKEPTLWKLVMYLNLVKSPGALAVANKLISLGVEVEASELIEFGIALNETGIEKQNKEVKEKLKKGKYDLVCISCTSALEYLYTKRIAELSKEVLPDTIVIAGGYHASGDPVDMLKSIPAIDMIVIGDFEPVAENLITAIKNNGDKQKIPNLVFRENNTINRSERVYLGLDFSRDVPPLHESPFDKFYPYYILHLLDGGRGCPYNRCNFCAEPIMRNRCTVKSVDRILSELEYIINYGNSIYGKDFAIPVGFSDPVWGLSRKWILDFCHKLEQKMKNFKAPFIWRIDMRLDQKNVDDLFPLLFRLGCRSVAFGVESFSRESLSKMNKALNIETYYNSTRKILKAAIDAHFDVPINIIFGWPGEQLKDVLKTMDKIALLRKEIGSRIRPAVYAATPLPGTKLWDTLDDQELKEKYGFKMLVPKRFWKEGIVPFVPIMDASRTLTGKAIANYALYSFTKETNIETDNKNMGSVFMRDKGFNEKLLNKDIITKEEILKYAEIMRNDYVRAGEMCFFEAFSSKRVRG